MGNRQEKIKILRWILEDEDMRNFFGYRLKFGHNAVRRKPTSTLISISQSKIFRTPHYPPLDVKKRLLQDVLTLPRFEDNFEDMINKQENPRVSYSADMYPAFSDINRDQFIKSPKQSDVDKSVIFRSILRDDPIRQLNRNAQYGHGSQRVINENAMLDFLNRCSNDLRCIHFLRRFNLPNLRQHRNVGYSQPFGLDRNFFNRFNCDVNNGCMWKGNKDKRTHNWCGDWTCPSLP